MKIIYDEKFINLFLNIWDYISQDSKIKANKFKFELRQKIENLTFMPYKCRKSIYFNNEDIRDLIYKGYTIVYKIDTDKNSIIILGIKKYKEKF